jgi:hypothetical protein
MHGDVMNTQQLMDPDRGKNVAKSDDDTKTTITRKKLINGGSFYPAAIAL